MTDSSVNFIQERMISFFMSSRIFALLLSLLLVFTLASCNGEASTTEPSTPEASEAETTDTSGTTQTTQTTQPTQDSSDHQSNPAQDPTDPEPAVMISVTLALFSFEDGRNNNFSYDLPEGATVGDLHRAHLAEHYSTDEAAPAFSDFNWKINGEQVDADTVLTHGIKVNARPISKEDSGNDTGRH